MKYGSCARPLYVPLQQLKSLATPVELDAGMQSLLDAIELEINATHDKDQESRPGGQSPFINLMDHEEMMADLLATRFENVSPGPINRLNDDDITSTAAIDDLQTMTPETESCSVHGLFALLTGEALDFQPPASPLQQPWSGLSEKFKDRRVRTAQIQSAIRKELPALIGEAKYPLCNTRVTRFTFAWPAVAQKSYGSERRLLTPPPVFSVEGHYQELCGEKPTAHLTICPEDTDLIPAEAESRSFDDVVRAIYKNVFINNAVIGKSKSITLNLQVAQIGLAGDFETPLIVIRSSSLALLTKPSIRSKKIKSHHSLMYAGDNISLYNRVNSQTASTKFLSVAGNELCAQADSWSLFQINSLEPDNKAVGYERSVPLHYNTKVVLRELRSGYTSRTFILRRLKGKNLVENHTGAISQMHKICLELAEPDAATIDQSGGTDSPNSLPQQAHRRKFLSSCLAQQRDATASSPERSSRTSLEEYTCSSESLGTIEINDFAQWTIVGVGCQQISFIDALAELREETDSKTNVVTPSKRTFSSVNGPEAEIVSTDTNSSIMTKNAKGPPDSKVDEVIAQQSRPKLTIDSPETHSDARFTKETDAPGGTQADPRRNDQVDASMPTKAVAQGGQIHSETPPPLARIQTPLTPLPALLSPPIIQSSILQLFASDYYQAFSCLGDPEIWLSAYGPCAIQSIAQISMTDVMINVKLPNITELNEFDYHYGDSLAILFVREDGVVVYGGARVDVTQQNF